MTQTDPFHRARTLFRGARNDTMLPPERANLAMDCARLALLEFTRSPEFESATTDADMCRLFAAEASSPGYGARLVIDADDPRLDDPVLQSLMDDREGLTSSDRDNREPEYRVSDTEPCGPPEDCHV